jgi:transposase InsO family protein
MAAQAKARQTQHAQQKEASARAGRSASVSSESKAAAEPERPALADSLAEAARKAAAADKEYQQWLAQPPSGMVVENGLLFDQRERLRVPNDDRLRTRFLAELHDSVTGVHCGRDRMLAEAQRRYEWRGMATSVEQYVATCEECQRNKASKQLTPGLLMPLPLPEEPCLYWTTDAVTGLPKSKNGYDAIQVFVDRLTKLKHFVPTRTTDTAEQLAAATLRAIISQHGMPKSIVSDRDPRITSKFWKELSRLLGSEVSMSTAHHPQSDGQSEREIQTLTTALRAYVNQRANDWDEYLPAVELGFNSKKQASTGSTPFMLVYGNEARVPIDCALDEMRPAPTVPAAADRAARMKEALDFARSNAERAQEKQKRLADRHRRLVQLKEGDRVLLSTDGLQLRAGTHKLTARYIGPFKVIGKVNDNAVTLELPPLLEALHPTFNISRLKLYHDGHRLFPDRPQRLTQPPAVETDTNGDKLYEVECILAQRGTRNRREMLVRWKGYGAEDDQWRPRGELTQQAPALVAEFDALQQGGSLAAAQTALDQILAPSQSSTAG